MADKVLTSAGTGHHGSTPSSLTSEQVREMEARIKRPSKVKKIDLESFDERDRKQQTPEQREKKRQQLISLTKRGAGPLRLREVEVGGNIVLHLGPRTWGQYFYEKLWLFPAEKEARRLEVRVAIERYIRPWLERNEKASQAADDDRNTPATVNNSKAITHTAFSGLSNLELLDRLHCRVYTKRIDPAAFFRNTPRVPTSLDVDGHFYTEHMRTAFRGITTIPKGLSIAQIAPFKVMADVRIMAPETRLWAEKYGAVGGNGTPCKEMRDQIKGNNVTPLQLEKYYRQLLDLYGNGENRIVLEVQGIGIEHWQAAYSAAKNWMTKNTASLMLVPLYRTEDYEAFGNSICDKKAWSSAIVTHLNADEALRTKRGKKTSGNYKSTGNPAAQQQQQQQQSNEEFLDF